MLRRLAVKGNLVRIGYGLYVKAMLSALTGKIVPVVPLPTLGKEALTRLKVEIVPTRAETAYATGRSTQVPTGRQIGVRGRVSRKIGYNGLYLTYEHD